MSSVEEDVSARVLLTNVLHSEFVRSPVTRSVSRNVAVSPVRQSFRLRNIPRNESPQATLRHKLRQKLHESATKSPLPPSKRAKSQSQRASSSLYDEDITPRVLLRGIIQTEVETSLLLSSQPAVLQAHQQPVEASLHSIRQSEGPSELELPDLVTEPLSNVIKGLSRRRPPPTFNVSAFEKQLDQQSGDGEENNVTEENTDVNMEQDISAENKSVLSLTLKTPFVNIQSERAGLRRKAASRTQPSVDAFDEAVQKRLEKHCNQDFTVVQDGKTLGDSNWQQFTLGLSNVTVPDITTDIIMSSTELYPQPTVSLSEQKEGDVGALELSRHGSEKADRNDDEELDQEEKVVDDNQDEHNMSKICESKRDPFQDMEDPTGDSLLQEEEKEIDMILALQAEEAIALCPDDIPFAPTQAMVEPVPQAQEIEGQEPEIREVEMEECEQRESMEDLSKVEVPSQMLERITRRAYHSEGGKVIPGITARGTKSLGGGFFSTEKGEGQSDIPEVEMGEIEQSESRTDNLSKVELPSQISERITRRAYHSEGGRVIRGVTARGTKSLGRELFSTEKDEGQSDIPEVEMGEIDQRESRMDDSSKVELPSQMSERITRRAYHSEGGKVIPGIIARGTKSLGGGLFSTEKGEGQSDIPEVEMGEIEQRESMMEDFSKVEVPSQMSERITRRAYHSEGGTVIRGVTARGTKSLGAGLYFTEKVEGHSGVLEAEMEETEQRESMMDDFSKVDVPSQISEQITRRAFHSESGTVISEVTARGTKSLGGELFSTEKGDGQSDIQEAEMEEIEQREIRMDDPSKVEVPSQISTHITRRAYNSEGGTVIPGVTARARGTKSLGAWLDSTEKEPVSVTTACNSEELPNLEEELCIIPGSSSMSPALKMSLSVSGQVSLDDEGVGTTEGNVSKYENENVVTSTDHHSPIPGSPAAEDEQQEEEEEEEDGHSEELSMQTPAFIRQRKEVATPSAQQTPTVLKVLNAGSKPKVVKPRSKRKTETSSHVLPKSYVMSVFKHFAKTKVAADVYPIINEILHKYFDRLADDLEAYSAHAKRKTIEVEDVELLMRRQRFVTDNIPVNVLIEKFLPLEYRKLLIPVATSGNKVIPNLRR